MPGRLEKLFPKLAFNHAIHEIKRNGFWFIDIPRTSSCSIKVEPGNTFGPVYEKANTIDKDYSKKSYCNYSAHFVLNAPIGPGPFS